MAIPVLEREKACRKFVHQFKDQLTISSQKEVDADALFLFCFCCVDPVSVSDLAVNLTVVFSRHG
jgi:hypothetical protein